MPGALDSAVGVDATPGTNRVLGCVLCSELHAASWAAGTASSAWNCWDGLTGGQGVGRHESGRSGHFVWGFQRCATRAWELGRADQSESITERRTAFASSTMGEPWPGMSRTTSPVCAQRSRKPRKDPLGTRTASDTECARQTRGQDGVVQFGLGLHQASRGFSQPRARALGHAVRGVDWAYTEFVRWERCATRTPDVGMR